jgi:hypothetical protein
MLDERLLDYDPSTGMKTGFSSSDDDGGTWNLRYEQDVSPLLDANKSAQADSWDKREDMWHAASIPNVVLMEWITKHGIEYYNPNHKEGVKRLLNSDEYRYLRVRNFII